MTTASVAGSVDVVVGPVEIVVGPKTRLGAALLERTRGATVALARDERDLAALAGREGVLAADASDEAVRAALGSGPLRVHVCALGPIHAEEPDPADADAVERELAALERLLDTAGDRDVHVVFISTVIALAPGDGQRYYGGWKCVVEDRLRALVDQHPSARLSVIYPGRLVGARNPRRPWQVGYTSYRRLAALALSTGEGRSRTRLVGADARAWLVLRTVALGLSSLTGRAGGPAADRHTRVSP